MAKRNRDGKCQTTERPLAEKAKSLLADIINATKDDLLMERAATAHEEAQRAIFACSRNNVVVIGRKKDRLSFVNKVFGPHDLSDTESTIVITRGSETSCLMTMSRPGVPDSPTWSSNESHENSFYGIQSKLIPESPRFTITVVPWNLRKQGNVARAALSNADVVVLVSDVEEGWWIQSTELLMHREAPALLSYNICDGKKIWLTL